jgi:hypothetical protein
LNHRDTPILKDDTWDGGVPAAVKPCISREYPPVRFILRNWYWKYALNCSTLFRELTPELKVLLLVFERAADIVKRRIGVLDIAAE